MHEEIPCGVGEQTEDVVGWNGKEAKAVLIAHVLDLLNEMPTRGGDIRPVIV